MTERRLRLTDRRQSMYVRRPQAAPYRADPWADLRQLAWDLARGIVGIALVLAFLVAIFVAFPLLAGQP